MIWQFVIQDRNNILHIIDEPIGWDNISTEVKRDLDTHGIFFDYQGNDFQFEGSAARLLKSEKDLYGIDGIATLIIKYACDLGFEELYRGRFVFGKYSFISGDECYVKISIETAGDVMNLRNKFDQPVDLESIKGFDEQTDLSPYPGLGKVIVLPSKGILVKDFNSFSSGVTDRRREALVPIPGGESIRNFAYSIPFDGQGISEIGEFYTSSEIDKRQYHTQDQDIFLHQPSGSANTYLLCPLLMSPLINYSQGSPNYGAIANPVSVSIKLNGSISVDSSSVHNVCLHFIRLPHRDNPENGTSESDYLYEFERTIYDSGSSRSNPKTSGTISFGIEEYLPVNFNLKDRFYFYLTIHVAWTTAQFDHVQATPSAYYYQLNISSAEFIAENLSKTEDTTCKSFLINEALSRASEAITNNKIKVFSDYFGRTDSQPYNRPFDGCGAMAAITKGLFIRRQEQKLVGRPPVFSQSLKQLFDGLDPIHHIGFGIETDPNRPGFNCLRVENWKYFYSDEIILTCNNVGRIDRGVQENEHYSLFSFGYEKWEAEEYTGLDEFLTKRKYRTTLNSISNELTKLSKFIASGYAIEITRRKGNEDSKDWRYDNDTFIICLARDGNNVVVEQGNILFPENIIDPDSVYNYRISPVRNAMRWFDKIGSGFKMPGKVIFTDGDGNFWAKGKYAGSCAMELVQMTENDTIEDVRFNDQLNAWPILEPERVLFDYSLSAEDFKRIKFKPYGLIAYNNESESGYGWIDTVSAKHNDGIGTFKLIPRK